MKPTEIFSAITIGILAGFLYHYVEKSKSLETRCDILQEQNDTMIDYIYNKEETND